MKVLSSSIFVRTARKVINAADYKSEKSLKVTNEGSYYSGAL